MKYTKLAQQMDAAERLWVRYSQADGARGIGRAEFPFDLLEPATRAKLLTEDSRFKIPEIPRGRTCQPSPPKLLPLTLLNKRLPSQALAPRNSCQSSVVSRQ
jgi:hypothetical protein